MMVLSVVACRRRCAEQADDLAGSDLDGHTVQDVRLAVVGVDVVEGGIRS